MRKRAKLQGSPRSISKFKQALEVAPHSVEVPAEPYDGGAEMRPVGWLL